MSVPMTEVDSKMMTHVGYHAPTSQLHVRWPSGKSGYYKNVPPDLHNSLMNSRSKGQFLNQYIKAHPLTYPYVSLD